MTFIKDLPVVKFPRSSVSSLPRGGHGEETAIQMKNEVKRRRRIIRTYHGLAGMMRRQVLAGVGLALAIGGVAILAGIYVENNHILGFRDTFLYVAIICFAGILAGGLLTLRLMALSLDAIERVESSIKQIASRENPKVGNSTFSEGEDQFNPLVQAYNLLVEHLDEIDTQYLEFLGKVTHDIRSPLAIIMGYAGLLEDPGYRVDEHFLDKCQRTILDEGHQISNLVQDVMITAGLDAGRYEITKRHFRIDILLFELVGEVKAKINHEIKYENQTGEVKIIGDSLGLREAILKLIDNSVKYSPPEKPIGVRLQPGDEPGWVGIAIRDEGIGIDELGKAMLFRRFGRIRNDSTRDIAGAGLGLYIAKNIVQQHNGQITVDSQLGEGSTFTILLPTLPQ